MAFCGGAALFRDRRFIAARILSVGFLEEDRVRLDGPGGGGNAAWATAGDPDRAYAGFEDQCSFGARAT